MNSQSYTELPDSLLSALLETSRDGFFVLDEEARVVYVNDRGADTIGYTQRGKQSIHLWDFELSITGKDEWDVLFAKLCSGDERLLLGKHRNMQTGVITNVEVNPKIAEIDGKRWVVASVRLIDDRITLERMNERNRELLSALAYIHQLLLEESSYIQALEKGFRRLAEVLDVDRIYLFQSSSVDGEVVTMSQRLEWNSEDATAQIDNPDLQLMPASIMQTAMLSLVKRELWEALIEDLAPSEERDILASQDIQSMMIGPVYLDGDNMWGFIGFDDCQKRREWTDEERNLLRAMCNALGSAIDNWHKASTLELRNQELERLSASTSEQNERLTNFAYTISHNMRSHSSNISGLLHLMEVEADPKRKTEYTAMLHKSASELARTIKDLNELVSGGYVESEQKERVELLPLVKDALSVVQNSLKSIDAQIVVDVKPEIAVFGRAAYLDSILLNLMTNAIKYRSLKRPLQLSVTAEADDNSIEVCVADNGKGIDLREHGEDLFGMYKTFHGNNDAVGLGLYLVKSQIEEMEGTVTVSSQPEQGTAFVINLKKWQ